MVMDGHGRDLDPKVFLVGKSEHRKIAVRFRVVSLVDILFRQPILQFFIQVCVLTLACRPWQHPMMGHFFFAPDACGRANSGSTGVCW